MLEHVEIVEADLERREHQEAVLAMTAAYALDPMGNDGPLPHSTLKALIDGLRSHPTTLIFLAFVAGRAAGIATCFRGFSTFLARPLLNVHDLAVLPEYRGLGLGRRLLAAVEDRARQTGCGKVTLEAQEGNTRARGVYEAAGFAQARYTDKTGGSLFYSKML